ncbi:MAG: DUF4139 domain-containing protein [Myxococcota bacterium]
MRLLRWLLVGGMGLAYAAAAAGCARGPAVRTSEDLPLKRVVLYRNGVGYFERQGEFEGDELEFQVRRNDVGDFLSSLTAVDGEGQVRSISFEIEDEEKEKNGKKPPHPPVPLPEDRGYVIVPPPEPPPDDGDDDDHDEKDDERVDVRLRLSGEDHRMSVSYVVAAPIWKPTYRVVFDDDGALLQAWAVVQNLSGEDWDDVLLSLTTGAPIAFRSDLGTPVTPPRPMVTDRGEVVHSVPGSETSLAQDGANEDDGEATADREEAAPEAPRSAPAPRRRRAKGAGAAAADARMELQAEAPSPEMHADDMQKSLVTQAAAATLSDGVTRYDFTHRVTVPDGGSTMVAILSERVPGESAHLFAPDGGVPGSHLHPFRIARFTNETGATLERGPLAVLGDGDFLGQGVLESLARGATTFVPFALDRSIAIEPDHRHENRTGRLIKVMRGQVVVEQMTARITRYEIRNGGDRDAKVYVRHQRMRGADFHEPPKGIERSPGKAIVPTKVPARGRTELVLEERTPAKRTVSFMSDAAAEAVKLYLEGSAVDAAAGPALRKALELRDRLATVQRELETLASRRKEVERALRETRANLKTIKEVEGAADLRRRLVRRIDELDREDGQIARSLVERRTEETELKVRIEEALADVTLVVEDDDG